MPIRPFLAGQAFEPKVIAACRARWKVCDALRLKMVDDAATRLVAQRIIELAQRGIHDPAILTMLTLKEFKYDD
jgi:hypothetical protein